MQDKDEVKHIDTNEEENPQSEHCKQDYTTPFFLREEEGTKSTVKSLKTTAKSTLHPQQRHRTYMTTMTLTVPKL